MGEVYDSALPVGERGGRRSDGNEEAGAHYFGVDVISSEPRVENRSIARQWGKCGICVMIEII